MGMFVGLDVSLKTTSICVVEADGSPVWEGKAESEPAPLVKALSRWCGKITLVGAEACPLSEWLYGALVESGFQTECIETRHAQRFLSSRPNKTDRSDARHRRHDAARALSAGAREEQGFAATANGPHCSQEVRGSHARHREHHSGIAEDAWPKLETG